MEAAAGETKRVLGVLEALKQASHELRTNPTSKAALSDSSAIEALLELQNETDSIIFTDPSLAKLAIDLEELRSLIQSLRTSCRRSLRSFLTRRFSAGEVSRLAATIESEIQSWIDRGSIEVLCKNLGDPGGEDDKLNALIVFQKRLSQGFDRELQDLVLRSRVLSSLESILCNANCSKRIREHSAFAIASLIRFNKDVFVGDVLMGRTVRALVSMASESFLTVLCLLIKSIKSPLVDEIESNGELPSIISFLNSQNLHVRLVSMDCVLEIGYYGRKQAIDSMMREGLVEKLVEMQRSELGCDLIDVGASEEAEDGGVAVAGFEADGGWRRRNEESAFPASRPFASCVARFGVMLEVGEGLRQKEKRAFKNEIVVRVRKACTSDAESSTIIAEVLWGSSP